MVATLLGLKLRLTIGELKRSIARLIIWIILALNALLGLLAILVGLTASSLAVVGNEAAAGGITILVGSILVFAWTVIPLVFFGFDQTMDPARFAQFSLTGRQLAPGLILAGVLGLPGFFTAILCLGSALPWILSPLVALVGICGGVLGFLMTQVCCRIATSALSGFLSTRKARDMMGLIGLVMILLLSMSSYSISLVSSMLSADTFDATTAWTMIEQLSSILAWTPLGSPWAMVADAGRGEWLMMVAHLGVTAVYLGLGFILYSAILNKSLTTPEVSQSSGLLTKDSIARLAGLQWVKGAMLPVAAIVARSLRYWRRDPRYLGQIISILMLPILFTVMGVGFPYMTGSGAEEQFIGYFSNSMIAFGLGFMALMAGYTISTDVAYDSTAWWIHLASGVQGWQDRLGRLIAQLLVSTPMLLIATIAVPWIVGNPAVVPKALTAMVCLFLVSLGVSSVFSALVIYPVALPGESPLKMKTGMMGSQMLSQMGCLGVDVVLSLPICLWAIFASGWLVWLALVAAFLWGGAATVIGVFWGGKIMDARGPAILGTLMKNDSRTES